jgi:alpha-tubulin suppressor-like RCC1 family protein
MAAKAQVSSEAKKNEDEEPKAGELLFCGGSNWEAIGKKQTDGGARGIFLPTRLAALQGIDIAFVASGSASCHCIALDVNGRCFTWGRNEDGIIFWVLYFRKDSWVLVTFQHDRHQQ